MQDVDTNNPLVHAVNLKEAFNMLIDHLRKDVERVEDPSAKALFEVAAEVLEGLKKAFTDYEQKNEAAWDT
ncbi:hypothetical protein [Niabella soli]|uniref:Uncharacterized protein n=1 Tax=Niabella soli DSM 19437 TaxID=929713 RepID=W0F075_9BACT|nr:hypothetical protein [Niabella soli]AHF14849.1 hypothetical protein NIASO_06120 [Niabella soli DSM 19437]